MKPSTLSNSSTKRSHKIWSQEEIKKLLSLLKEKIPMKDIGQILTRSQKSIRRKCDTLKISSATTYNLTEKTNQGNSQKKNTS